MTSSQKRRNKKMAKMEGARWDAEEPERLRATEKKQKMARDALLAETSATDQASRQACMTVLLLLGTLSFNGYGLLLASMAAPTAIDKMTTHVLLKTTTTVAATSPPTEKTLAKEEVPTEGDPIPEIGKGDGDVMDEADTVAYDPREEEPKDDCVHSDPPSRPRGHLRRIKGRSRVCPLQAVSRLGKNTKAATGGLRHLQHKGRHTGRVLSSTTVARLRSQNEWPRTTQHHGKDMKLPTNPGIKNRHQRFRPRLTTPSNLAFGRTHEAAAETTSCEHATENNNKPTATTLVHRAQQGLQALWDMAGPVRKGPLALAQILLMFVACHATAEDRAIAATAATLSVLLLHRWQKEMAWEKETEKELPLFLQKAHQAVTWHGLAACKHVAPCLAPVLRCGTILLSCCGILERPTTGKVPAPRSTTRLALRRRAWKTRAWRSTRVGRLGGAPPRRNKGLPPAHEDIADPKIIPTNVPKKRRSKRALRMTMGTGEGSPPRKRREPKDPGKDPGHDE